MIWLQACYGWSPCGLRQPARAADWKRIQQQEQPAGRGSRGRNRRHKRGGGGSCRSLPPQTCFAPLCVCTFLYCYCYGNWHSSHGLLLLILSGLVWSAEHCRGAASRSEMLPGFQYRSRFYGPLVRSVTGTLTDLTKGP